MHQSSWSLLGCFFLGSWLLRYSLLVGVCFKNAFDVVTGGNYLFVRSYFDWFSFFQKHDARTLFKELDLVSYEYNNLVLQFMANAIVEDIFGNLWINCAQRVIEQIDVSISIDSSCQTDSSLLTSRDVDASFSY